MIGIEPIRPPRELGKAGRAVWRDVAEQMASDGLEPDRRERRYLLLACCEADELAELEAALASMPKVVRGSQGQDVANPLIAECRRSRTFIAVQLARIEMFDSEAGKGSGSGSRTTSTQARAAALSRHHKRSA